VIDHFAERGHHRFTIDPSTENERAIRAYEKTGFKPIGVARRCEQLREGEWTDGLMMDLLVSDLE
jgi:aminoglycoside 6'-N-acetyltransferase